MSKSFTVAGEAPYNRFHRVIASGGPLPERHMVITGPEEAFEVQALTGFDLVKIIDPALVNVERFRVAP